MPSPMQVEVMQTAEQKVGADDHVIQEIIDKVKAILDEHHADLNTDIIVELSDGIEDLLMEELDKVPL